MKFTVVVETRAERDIETIVEWIAEESEGAALAWYGSVRAAIESLDMFPERCPLAPEDRLVSREIRQLLHGKSRYRYRILFTIKGKMVHVLHILHGARDWLDSEAIELP